MDKYQILKEIKHQLGFTSDADFARFLGISPQTLSSWYRRKMYDIDVLYAKCVDINPEFLISGRGEMLRKSAKNNVEHSSGVAIMDGSPNSSIHQDNRVITSDSPDVLRAQIDLLDERIKEKDAQIKEKDAQIAKLLDILSKK